MSSASITVSSYETGEPAQRLNGFTTDDATRKLSLNTISITLHSRFEWRLQRDETGHRNFNASILISNTEVPGSHSPVIQSFLGLCLDVMTLSEACTCLIWITGL